MILLKPPCLFHPHPPQSGPPVSLRLGHRTALALLTQFTTVLPLRYPILGKALFWARPSGELPTLSGERVLFLVTQDIHCFLSTVRVKYFLLCTHRQIGIGQAGSIQFNPVSLLDNAINFNLVFQNTAIVLNAFC